MADTTTAAIEALMKNVTPGSWEAVSAGQADGIHEVVVFEPAYISIAEADGANARFIAWCREGVPALAAERDAAQAEVIALRKEVERLRAALEPLAAMAKRYDPDEGDDGHLECWSGLAVPKIHHLRKARTALTAEPLGLQAASADREASQ